MIKLRKELHSTQTKAAGLVNKGSGKIVVDMSEDTIQNMDIDQPEGSEIEALEAPELRMPCTSQVHAFEIAIRKPIPTATTLPLRPSGTYNSSHNGPQGNQNIQFKAFVPNLKKWYG